MSQNSFEQISVQNVFNLLTNYMKGAHDVLLNVLHEQPNYKDLLEKGEKQFFDAQNEIDSDVRSKKLKADLSEANKLAEQIDKDIDKIVQEKFQGEVLDNLKAEILQAIMLLSSDQINKTDVNCEVSTSPVKQNQKVEKTVLAQTKNLKKNGVLNSCDTKKKQNNVTNGQVIPHLETKLENDNWDPDLSMISIESVSSVHTSDLSSFEDEISVSSNEENGTRRRISLKEVTEKLEHYKSEIMKQTENNQQRENKLLTCFDQGENAQSDSPVNNNESYSIPQKSQRRRKPNMKYTDDVETLPLKKKTIEKVTRTQSVCGDLSRKRGRRRKLST